MRKELENVEVFHHGDELTPETIGQKNEMRLPTNIPMSNWIRAQFEDGYQGWALDVGASDGRFINSTWDLERNHRWTVLSVEANPLMKPLLISERAFVEICAVGTEEADDVDFHVHLDSLEAFSALKPVSNNPKYQPGARWGIVKTKVRRADTLLAKWQFPRLDALCVDVEGGELDVLNSIDIPKWSPRVIVLESWKQGEFDEYLKERGYQRFWRSADNDCYVRV